MSSDRNAETERMIEAGELEQVQPSQPVALRLLRDADAHVGLAQKGVKEDPAGALQLAYDAARKAAAALLAVQGLRATTRGGHVAVVNAVRSQFDGRTGSDVFGRIHRVRRRRHASEYPSVDSPGVTMEDARDAIDVGRRAIAEARRLLLDIEA